MEVVVLLEGSDGGGGFLFFDLSLPLPLLISWIGPPPSIFGQGPHLD